MILLVTACVGLTAVARHRGWPAPLLVTGVALAAAGIPWLPEFGIDSHVILTLVLPPLLYSAALDVSLLNFTRSRRKTMPAPRSRRTAPWTATPSESASSCAAR